MKLTKKVLASALALSVVIGAGTMTSLAAGAEDGALPGGQPKCAGGRDIYLNMVVVEDGPFLLSAQHQRLGPGDLKNKK